MYEYIRTFGTAYHIFLLLATVMRQMQRSGTAGVYITYIRDCIPIKRFTFPNTSPGIFSMLLQNNSPHK